MPRLLAPEGPAAPAELVEHVAVAYGGDRHLDPGRGHCRVEAVVGHHGHSDAVAWETPVPAQVGRGERHELVPVDHGPGAVDREHPVTVAVEREADVVPPAPYLLDQPVQVRRAAAGVDVDAVGLGRNHRRLRPEPEEDLGGGLIGGAMGAIEQHAPPAQVEAAEAAVELAQVVLERPFEMPDPADVGRRRGRLGQVGLDLVLGVVGELEPVAREQLDPVVLVGVVRGGDDRRQVEAVPAHEQRRRRCGQHSGHERVSARGGDAGGDRRLEHLTRLARVSDDQNLGALDRRMCHGRPRHRQREVGRQEVTGAAPDSIRAEQLAWQRVSAWRTAAACGPS